MACLVAAARKAPCTCRRQPERKAGRLPGTTRMDFFTYRDNRLHAEDVDLVELAAQTAAERDQTGWLLTLDFPSYFPVMTYADDAGLREEMYRAYQTRASDEGPFAGQFDNSENMERILALRHEQAQLLGFDNYAECSLARKMARSTDEVLGFLHDLAARTRPQAERELAELRAYAAQQQGVDELNPWDIAYYSEKLRQHRHNISQEEVKPYFPETRVVPGMFEVVGRLYGVSFHQVEGVDTWHPDVRFYEIRDHDGRPTVARDAGMPGGLSRHAAETLRVQKNPAHQYQRHGKALFADPKQQGAKGLPGPGRQRRRVDVFPE